LSLNNRGQGVSKNKKSSTLIKHSLYYHYPKL
jgi:hypothetical protein